MSTFGCSCESINLIAQITKVILADLKIEDFINDRCEVSKRADEAERRRITVAKEAAGGSEQQDVLDGNQGHATFMAPCPSFGKRSLLKRWPQE